MLSVNIFPPSKMRKKESNFKAEPLITLATDSRIKITANLRAGEIASIMATLSMLKEAFIRVKKQIIFSTIWG
jgi:hypothetical protein